MFHVKRGAGRRPGVFHVKHPARSGHPMRPPDGGGSPIRPGSAGVDRGALDHSMTDPAHRQTRRSLVVRARPRGGRQCHNHPLLPTCGRPDDHDPAPCCDRAGRRSAPPPGCRRQDLVPPTGAVSPSAGTMAPPTGGRSPHFGDGRRLVGPRQSLSRLMADQRDSPARRRAVPACPPRSRTDPRTVRNIERSAIKCAPADACSPRGARTSIVSRRPSRRSSVMTSRCATDRPTNIPRRNPPSASAGTSPRRCQTRPAGWSDGRGGGGAGCP